MLAASRRPTEDWFIDAGDGPPLVLAHGAMLDKSMYEAQIADLSRDFRVIAYDQRARRENWQGPYTLEDLGQDCLELVDALEIDRFVLGGMSMGGYLAVPLALRIQDRLDGLVLIATMAGSLPPAALEANEVAVDGLLGHDLVPRAFAEWDAEAVFSETTRRERPKLVESYVERCAALGAEAVYWEFHSWLRKADELPRLAELTMPALIVHGEDDLILPVAVAVAMAERLPDATLVRLAGAGHTLPDEAPEATTRALRAFMERIHER